MVAQKGCVKARFKSGDIYSFPPGACRQAREVVPDLRSYLASKGEELAPIEGTEIEEQGEADGDGAHDEGDDGDVDDDAPQGDDGDRRDEPAADEPHYDAALGPAGTTPILCRQVACQ